LLQGNPRLTPFTVATAAACVLLSAAAIKVYLNDGDKEPDYIIKVRIAFGFAP
jgi:hypothetical protein